jgi:hypothetical protein
MKKPERDRLKSIEISIIILTILTAADMYVRFLNWAITP